jgi:alpha-beta hydrolase superfamily lysophospholipase
MVAAAAASAPVSLKFDSGFSHEGEGPLKIAVDVFAPPGGAAPRALLWCLPGGNMNRRYYDLIPPAEAGWGDIDTSFSFARTLAAQGYVVASVDYLGLGDSSKPNDGWLCTPDTLTAINKNVYEAVSTKLRDGRAHPQLAAVSNLRSVGVGHSMGAMMTILQQHAHAPHAAVVLLGFSTRGLPEYLPPQLKGLDDPLAARPLLIDVAKKMYGAQPFPVIHTSRDGARAGNSELFGSRKAEPKGVAALKAATDCMLPIPATLSMVPGNVAAEAATIAVPVFLGVGGRDMVGPVHQVPTAFTGSSDITLLVLAETGHSHFLFATRELLFRRVAAWIEAVGLN